MLKHNGLSSALALFMVTGAPVVYSSALPVGSLLQISASSYQYDQNGNPLPISAGSWFAFDTDNNSRISEVEKMPLSPGSEGGLRIGAIQQASGGHTGFPNGSEIAPIDAPWSFLGNTGMHFTVSEPNVVNGDTANGLDLSGWRMAWNLIPELNFSGGAWNPLNCAALDITICAFQDGVAQFLWNGVDGGAFRLLYSATVPDDDPYGYAGLQYFLNLEGTVNLAEVPLPAAAWLMGAGMVALLGVARRRGRVS